MYSLNTRPSFRSVSEALAWASSRLRKGPTLRPHQCSLCHREMKPHHLFPGTIVHGGGCVSLPSPASTWFSLTDSRVLWAQIVFDLFPIKNVDANFEQTIHGPCHRDAFGSSACSQQIQRRLETRDSGLCFCHAYIGALPWFCLHICRW